jgi:hypothetical protein
MTVKKRVQRLKNYWKRRDIGLKRQPDELKP